MAERIVSPGVFTRERDLSFLPQGIADIGAAIIGPTLKGPAFVPTVVRNFTEFEEMYQVFDAHGHGNDLRYCQDEFCLQARGVINTNPYKFV